MTQPLITLPTNTLLSKFGSGGHKPGSGSAAALLGLVSCKLLQTVVSLTAGREQYKGVEAQLTLANQDILSDVEPLLLAAIQEDSDQFDRVILARRLRDQATDKNERRHLSEKALAELRDATEIPLRILEACLRLAEKGLVVFDLGFKAARGDSGVAVSAALAGASGALSIIFLNLTCFKGGEWAVAMRKKTDVHAVRVQALQIELLERVARLQNEAIAREGSS